MALIKRELGDQAAAALAAALARHDEPAGDQAAAIDLDATRAPGDTVN
jgi:hypothetical protein